MAVYRRSGTLMVAALTLGLVASGCSRTAEAPPAKTSASPTATSSSPAAQAATGAADLAALVPVPADTSKKRGPDPIADNGIHQYFEVAGAPDATMNAFKTALQAKGWDVTTVGSSEHGEGGGATFTGTLGAAYGVFKGGGYQSTTYIDVCAWPAKPAKPDCDHGR